MSSITTAFDILPALNQHEVKHYAVMLSTDFDRDAVAVYFGMHKDIQHWFYTLPYSIFVKTHLTAAHISDMLDKNFGVHAHLVMEVTSNYYGRLDVNLWKYFPAQ